MSFKASSISNKKGKIGTEASEDQRALLTSPSSVADDEVSSGNEAHNDWIDGNTSERLVPSTVQGVSSTYGSLSNTISPQHHQQMITPSETYQISDRQLRRAVTKTGVRNVKQNLHYFERPFWSDIFTTFLDAQWRWLILVICVSYLGSWLLFGVVWYVILEVHGDLIPSNLDNPDWKPCVTNILDFTSTFLFSLETQQTTGYGFYHLTEQCPSAVITLCVQSIVGVILEGLVVGLVLLKMSRAKKRAATLLFSKAAVIAKRDGILTLCFRVADLRSKSALLQATIRAQMINTRTTQEGEEIPINQEELEVKGDGEAGNTLLLYWPTMIVHKITEKSPLRKYINEDGSGWKNVPDSPFTSDSTSFPAFEIIAILEGVVESTGLLTQLRTSYLPSEICFNCRFRSLRPIDSQRNSDSRYIDYDQFHDIYPIEKDWTY